LQGTFRALFASGLAYGALLQPDIRFHVASAFGSILRLADPETAHRFTIQCAKLGLIPRDSRPDDPRLRIRLWGRTFTNPLGVAAGFDKDAEAMEAILGMGLGFMEVGVLFRFV
jgi:dihydroorotate dehydrogenase